MLKRLIKNCYFWFIGVLSLFRLDRKKPIFINIIGDLFSESGLGSTTRQIIESIAGLNGQLEYQLINLPMSIKSTQRDTANILNIGTKLKPGINLFIGNPDILLLAFLRFNPVRLIQNYNIGVWFWELEGIPKPWRNTSKLIDEVWAQSQFVADVFRANSKKSCVMPFSLDTVSPSNRSKASFGIPDGKFTFLFTFDFLSHTNRKNPSAVIESFLSAFNGQNDVQLVVKAVNGSKAKNDLKTLRDKIRSHENIILLDQYLSYEDLLCLIQSADCYVSLHRSEGLGLGMAEAMRLGTVVMATGYSGNLEFMKSDNSLLVDYKLVPVSRTDYPYGGKSFWADPSIRDASIKMKFAKEHSGEMVKLGKQALISMQNYNSKNQGQWIAQQLSKTS